MSDWADIAGTIGLVLGPLLGMGLQQVLSARLESERRDHSDRTYWREQRVNLFAELMELGHRLVHSGADGGVDADTYDQFLTLIARARVLAGGADLRSAAVAFYKAVSHAAMDRSNWTEEAVQESIAKFKGARAHLQATLDTALGV